MPEVKYEMILAPVQGNLATIDKSIHDANLASLGEASDETINNFHKVLILVKDEANKIIGGVHGALFSDWLHIDTLWVEERHRGHGIGTELLRRVEEAAIQKGFFGSHLETTDCQELDFYLEHGYTLFGELEGKPSGSSCYYIKKKLR
jgi:GNAT superfamily N-acetyltransferase